MAKSTKIIAIVLSCLVAACCVTIGISTVMHDDKPTTTLPTVSQTQQTSPTVSTTTQTTTAKKEDFSRSILGLWRDSADMSGYEFFSDGTVEITYVNLTVPVINLPVNGTTKGIYTLEGDKLTTKFSIYSATIEDSFRVSVKGNELSMTNLKEGETATYRRVTQSETTTTTTKVHETTFPTTVKNDVLYDDELIGAWVDNEGDRYAFSYDGSVEIRDDDESFSGIYLTDNGKLTIQYVDSGKKKTEKYTYTVSKNSLSLIEGKDETLFIREGTGTVNDEEDDLLGVWRDGANMSGFEFESDGICKITYVNFTVPVVNIPINGTFTGTYSISGNQITISASIYGTSIRDVYEFSVSGNALTMKNIDTGDEINLMKQ